MPRSGSLTILPSGSGAFMRRRAAELVGLICLGLATTLAVALLSYSPGDPSLNHVTEAPPANLLGHPGAIVADLLLHTGGLAAAVPVVGIAAWGWHRLGKRSIGVLWLRAIALAGAFILMATALAGGPTVPGWPLIAGGGGAIGRVILDALAAQFAGDAALTPPLIASAALLGGLVLWLFGSGLGLNEWRDLADGVRHAGRAGRAAYRRASAGAGAAATRLRHLLTESRAGRPGANPAAGRPPSRRAPGKGVTPPPAAGAPLVEKAAKAKAGRQGTVASQASFDFGEDGASGYQPPPLDLLHLAADNAQTQAFNRDGLEQNARMLASVLDDFGVRGDIVKVRPGPVITLYELEPAPGTKSSRVIGLADDIARSMSAISARVAVVPGRNVIGIELPNLRRETVALREMLAADAFERCGGSLVLALGKDIGGGPVCVDLSRMPHLLIAGTTGSGKSVAINAMILSLLYRLPPEACRLILIDPKMLELSVYDGIPHLLAPVVTEPGKAVVALKWTVREMEDRYRAMSQLGVRNIAGYNARIAEARRKGETLVRRVQTGFDQDGQPVFEEQPLDLHPLPLIVVVVDEMADLMLVAGKDIEAAVQRLAQMARAAGIHLIMATQRPSVDVITGTIKANFPTRVSFQVSSKIDSRTILGEQGAEQLLGQGDMLFMAPGGRLTRVHGPFVSDDEVEAVVAHIKAQGAPRYVPEVTEEDDEAAAVALDGDSDDVADELYEEAREIVLREGKASTSFVQRRLQIGYNRAARLIERMEAEGLVSKPDRVGRREVLIGEHAS
ncbi:MAG: DNA translocase FtsK 4TM domain-containing protein [Rhodospirillales bacterium]|nr:DNA translocase FtsK 4TM domain-containing protein [Rhodospirillales bacterium]